MKALTRYFFFISVIFFTSSTFSNEAFLNNLTLEKIPDADEAFSFSVSKQSEERIILTWVMKENCFLYKDKFKVTSRGKDLVALNTLGKPKKINDIYFGEVEVYFDSFGQEILLENKVDSINVTYQGCNEKGFCYPLINKTVNVEELNNS